MATKSSLFEAASEALATDGELIVCSLCDKTLKMGARKKCSRCKRAYYCSVECQRVSWPRHRTVCKAPVVEAPRKPEDSMPTTMEGLCGVLMCWVNQPHIMRAVRLFFQRTKDEHSDRLAEFREGAIMVSASLLRPKACRLEFYPPSTKGSLVSFYEQLEGGGLELDEGDFQFNLNGFGEIFTAYCEPSGSAIVQPEFEPLTCRELAEKLQEYGEPGNFWERGIYPTQ